MFIFVENYFHGSSCGRCGIYVFSGVATASQTAAEGRLGSVNYIRLERDLTNLGENVKTLGDYIRIYTKHIIRVCVAGLAARSHPRLRAALHSALSLAPDWTGSGNSCKIVYNYQTLYKMGDFDKKTDNCLAKCKTVRSFSASDKHIFSQFQIKGQRIARNAEIVIFSIRYTRQYPEG
ncbi:MAG: hypothetical protein LBH06_05525 [Rikenellaceae bacterium]|jgi:hypothetical protein|nr:hypothetical protein [Rikenellaceae bacterium]